jgi:hypothetical protein
MTRMIEDEHQRMASRWDCDPKANIVCRRAGACAAVTAERVGRTHGFAWTVVALLAVNLVAGLAVADAPGGKPQVDANVPPPGMSAVEHDWLRQAEALDAWRQGVQHGATATTQGDAAGAVDGVKDGKYAFHAGHEPNPWWQVGAYTSGLGPHVFWS